MRMGTAMGAHSSRASPPIDACWVEGVQVTMAPYAGPRPPTQSMEEVLLAKGPAAEEEEGCLGW